MPDHNSALRELILQNVPLDGSIGNKSLLERLIRAAEFPITEADYRQARDRLIAEGLLVAGRGRGGSVMRAPQTQDRGDEEQELSLHAQEAPPPKPAAGRRAPRSAPKPRSAAGQAKQILSYRYSDRRKNNPHVGMVDTASDGVEEESVWSYDPHIDPALNFDVGRAQIERLIDDALASNDEAVMRQALQQLKRMQAPYLNWTGKAELDEELLEQFHGTVSLPFPAGESRRIAVKIVDNRGIESLKIMDLT